MKKLIFITFLLLNICNLKAQFSFGFTPSDSIWHNLGGWTALDLYQQKDSTAHPYSSFWRFTSRIIEARSLSSDFPNERHDTLVVVRPDGRFMKMSKSQLVLSLGQVTTALGYVPLSNTVTVPSAQNLSINQNTISISGGNSITLTYLPISRQTFTFSGVTLQTVYNITHGLGFTPSSVFIQAKSNAGAEKSYISAINGTTFQITFLTVPILGTNNIIMDCLFFKQ